MAKWFVLAPGPSMSQQLADSVKGESHVCVVGNSYELAPWAECLVASDRVWWSEHPQAMDFQGGRFAAQRIEGTNLVNPCSFGTASNSGVLALDLLRNIGAKEMVLLGFDSHGSHFFGEYKNRCRNTPDRRRHEHRLQFKNWAYSNKGIKVINCTPGSLLDAFPFGELGDHLGGC